jgi:DNA-binding transcriptional regulator YbjK
MARPSKLTPELKQKFVTALRAGLPLNRAADFSGITYETARAWIAKGKTQQSGEFFEFSADVKKAQADCVGRLVDEIAKDGSWQSKAWILERVYPFDFSQERRRHLSEILDKLQATLPPETLAQVADALTDSATRE